MRRCRETPQEGMTVVDDAGEASDLLGARVRVPSGVVYRDFANETVVLNLDTGLYHGLNPTAGKMLAAIERLGSISEAADSLAEEYGRSQTEVRRDLVRFCEALVERSLLIVERDESAVDDGGGQ
jgi:hypothetical protein